jgi:hypothetical protein
MEQTSIFMLVKVRMNKNRSQAACTESVSLKGLIKLSKLSFHNWSFELVGDSWWLVLEAI